MWVRWYCDAVETQNHLRKAKWWINDLTNKAICFTGKLKPNFKNRLTIIERNAV